MSTLGLSWSRKLMLVIGLHMVAHTYAMIRHKATSHIKMRADPQSHFTISGQVLTPQPPPGADRPTSYTVSGSAESGVEPQGRHLTRFSFDSLVKGLCLEPEMLCAICSSLTFNYAFSHGIASLLSLYAYNECDLCATPCIVTLSK